MKPESEDDFVIQIDRKSEHESAPATHAERKPEDVLSLFGTIEYDPDYDYKKERQRRRS